MNFCARMHNLTVQEFQYCKCVMELLIVKMVLMNLPTVQAQKLVGIATQAEKLAIQSCFLECSKPGEMRLVNGLRTDEPEGRVELCIEGKWTTVCYNYYDWNDRGAEVACRQLGYGTEGRCIDCNVGVSKHLVIL